MTMTPEVQQIANTIEKRFAAHIDLSDNPNDRVAALRTRGLTALAVQMLADVDVVTAANAVVDGFLDGGIDAVHADVDAGRLLLVQTKWHAKGGVKTIELGDALKFLSGVQELLNERYTNFNSRIKKMSGVLSAVLRQPLHITLVVATTGLDQLGAATQLALDNFCAEMTAGGVNIDQRVLGQSAVHAFVRDGLGTPSVDMTVIMENWGTVPGPHTAFYGTVSAVQIAAWYRKYGDQLFEGNLRRALGATTVNQRVISTLQEDSQRFWYLNNGITMLARDVYRNPVGGASRSRGEFSLTAAGVVNGAQTVASIAAAAQADPASVVDAQVWVRMISLQDSPDWFGAAITRATNTQNHVVDRDFAALDRHQHQLRRDFALTVGKTYVIQRGEPHPGRHEGCTVEEAAIALACAHPEIRFAVLAKANPGRLWDTSDRGAYHEIFSEGQDAPAVWRWINVLWQVENTLADEYEKRTGKPLRILIHGDRLITHLVMRSLDRQLMQAAEQDWATGSKQILTLTRTCCERLIQQVDLHFAENYLASLFKNLGKCRQLADLVRLSSDASIVAATAAHPNISSTGAVVGVADVQEGAKLVQVQFYLASRKVSARGHLLESGFIVRAGSLAAGSTSPSMFKYQAGYAARREMLIAEGALIPSPNHQDLLVLVRDEAFESPSQASSVMLGRPSNGRHDWRSIDGESINHVLRWSS